MITVGALKMRGMTAPVSYFGAMHGTTFLAHVERVPVSSAPEPGDMVAMDSVPPPASCYAAQLFGLTIDEFYGHHDASGGRHPPSEFP